MKTVPIFIKQPRKESDQNEKAYVFKERQRYSIRKYSFGLHQSLMVRA